MRAAGEFHRSVLADPKLKKKYQAIAAKKKITALSGDDGGFSAASAGLALTLAG